MLDKMIELKEMHDDLYKNKGFIDINSGGVHVTTDFFYDTFDDFEVIERENYQHPVELEAEHKGVKFFTVLDNKEAIKLRNKKEVIA